MKLKVNAETLQILCAPFFTLEACRAIVDFFEETGDDGNFTAGDLCLSFSEIPAHWRDDYSENEVLTELSNGNILVLN